MGEPLSKSRIVMANLSLKLGLGATATGVLVEGRTKASLKSVTPAGGHRKVLDLGAAWGALLRPRRACEMLRRRSVVRRSGWALGASRRADGAVFSSRVEGAS